MVESVPQAAVEFAEDYFLKNRELIQGNDTDLGVKKWKLFLMEELDQLWVYRVAFGKDPAPNSDLAEGVSFRLSLMIYEAGNHREVFDAGVELVQLLEDRNQPLPALLADWKDAVDSGQLKRPKKHGRSKYAYWGRDLCIAWAIYKLENVGIKPTRNDASKQPDSGCDIVVEALKAIKVFMSYDAVKAIWKRYSNLKAPLSDIEK